MTAVGRSEGRRYWLSLAALVVVLPAAIVVSAWDSLSEWRRGWLGTPILVERGATVMAVSDISGGAFNERGLDLGDVAEWIKGHGSLEGYPLAEHVSNAELLELPCDILVLATLEDQIGAENAGRIEAHMIAEGANGPTSIEADAILADRGIHVLPDILTNAGGVTVSYFEWVQDLGRLFWSRDEIRHKLAEKMGDAFDRVWQLSEQLQITPRRAALVAAIREVSAALTARGIYP